MTLETARDAAARRIRDRELVVLVVGDRETIEPGLQELGHPIVEVDTEGRPVAWSSRHCGRLNIRMSSVSGGASFRWGTSDLLAPALNCLQSMAHSWDSLTPQAYVAHVTIT